MKSNFVITVLVLGIVRTSPTSYEGDLHSSHRQLSSDGQLTLSINGRGYFQYRLRTANTSMYDEYQTDPSEYSNGYMDETQGSPEIRGAVIIITKVTDVISSQESYATGASPHFVIASGDANTKEGEQILVENVYGQICAAKGLYTVRTNSTANATTLDVQESIPVQDIGDECVAQDISNAESQVVYSRDGSVHVNKYGYLVDDNGLLLVIAYVNGINPYYSADSNAKFHAHISSRATGIIVTPTGKILVREGVSIGIVGQIKLVRFENQDGLDVKLRMKSNCAAANEYGFALGTWCEGSELDGKQHTYFEETIVSGPGILGKPGDQGFGRLSN